MSSEIIANVLVFDSGVGGLSVLGEIQKILPNLNFTYLFDNEAYPYGELNSETLIQRSSLLIQHVVEQREIDVVVVACNTASTIVLPRLREQLSIPIVGVVPAIKPACQLSSLAVALLATPATVKRDYTKDLIKLFSLEKQVHLLGSTELVNMAEDKLRGIPVSLENLASILLPLKQTVDVIVLGCTHFPLLKDEIYEVLGKEIKLVDSGYAIAKRVESLLKGKVQQRSKREHCMLSSAAPRNEEALVKFIKTMGFSQIERCLLKDL